MTPTQPNMLTAIAKVEAKIDNLTEEVKSIKERLYGNGKDGIIVEQANQNATLDKLLELAEKNTACIDALKAESTSKYLARNWRTLLAIAVFFFLFLHSILPADLSVWTLFSKLFGG